MACGLSGLFILLVAFSKSCPHAFLKSEEFHCIFFNLAPLHWCSTIFACQGNIMWVCKIIIFQHSFSMHQLAERDEERQALTLVTDQEVSNIFYRVYVKHANVRSEPLANMFFCLWISETENILAPLQNDWNNQSLNSCQFCRWTKRWTNISYQLYQISICTT